MNSFKFTFVLAVVSIFTSCTKINSVFFDSAPESIFKGDSIQLKARVFGDGTPNAELSWAILDPVVKGTSISNSGLLTISSAETANSITIKVISVGDKSKTAVHKIKIESNPKMAHGTWESVIDGVTHHVIITESSFTFKTLRFGWAFTINDLNWAPAINKDPATKKKFSSGFYLNGAVNLIDGVFSDVFTGDFHSYACFLSRDEKEIIIGMNGSLPNRVWRKK